MATVLKSNSVAKKYLASAMSLSVPADYRALLDFGSEKFKLDSIDKTLTDLLSVTRGSTAGYINNSGVYASAVVNVARLHNDINIGKGLLIEPSFLNLLANPTAPAAQSITLTLSTSTWLMLQVFGIGSCNVEIRDSASTLLASGISTEKTPFSYKAAVLVAGATVTVTPTDISHFQLYTSGLPRSKQTKSGVTSIAADVILFNKALLASLLAVRNELTVVLRKREFGNYGDIAKSIASSGTILQIIEEANTKGIFVAKQTGGALNKGILRTNQTAEASVTNKVSISSEVFAMTFSATEAKMLQNGSIVILPITEALNLTRLYLGGGITWSTTFEQLIKEIYIYDRKLTDLELMQIIY